MNVKKILVSGGDGDFAKSLLSIFDRERFELFLVNRGEMDVRDIFQIEKTIEKIKPDYFIHAAALTRPMDIHEKNPEKSILNNIVGTSNVVLACMNKNIKLIYLSTDYVYPGTKGNYSENDPVFPVNEYAWSKLGGECSVMLYENSCILRMAMVKKPFPHNAAIVDSYKSSIFIEDAAKISLELIDKFGIYNVGEKRMSIYEFAKKTIPGVKKLFLKEIKNVKMAKDSSMNIGKINNELKND